MDRERDFTEAAAVVAAMEAAGDPVQARQLARFFKTAPGEYGAGDRFLGLKVLATRAFAKRCDSLPLSEVETLLASPWHEVRLCALLSVVSRFEQTARPPKRPIQGQAAHDAVAARDSLVDFYLAHARCANNWDLVDLTVYKILGRWLMLPSRRDSAAKLAVMDRLAASDNLWEQRMSVVATMEPLRHGDASFTLRYALWHLHHPHDLMHKAVGWLLREMGKRVGPEPLRAFLTEHAATMPRTALRYAIERLDPAERRHWLTARDLTNAKSTLQQPLPDGNDLNA